MNIQEQADKVVADFLQKHKKSTNEQFNAYYDEKNKVVEELIEMQRTTTDRLLRKNIIRTMNRLFKSKFVKFIEQNVMKPLLFKIAKQGVEKSKEVGKEKQEGSNAGAGA